MKRNVIALLFILFAGSLFAQNRVLVNSNPAMENGSNLLSSSFINAPKLIFDSPLQYPGEIPGTTTFWDYQTNGACLRGIQVFGDTILIAFPASDSADALGATTRIAYYLYSADGGTTWSSPLQLQQLPNRSAYPDVHRIVFSGIGTSVLVSGRKYNAANSRGGLWVDALFGLGGFSTAYAPEPGRDMFGDNISGNSYGSMFSSPITTTTDSLFYVKFNYVTNALTGKINLATSPTNISGNVRYRLASDNSGNNLFAMWYDNTTGAYAMRYKTSTDAGTTWSSASSLQTAFGIGGVVNGDTCSPWFGIDAAYKPGTTQWAAVWSTLFPTATGQSSGDPQGCKILFASPSINGGLPVEVAGRTNMNIISDTSLFFNSAALQVGVTPVSHPTIAFSSDGSRIAVAFSGYQPGDTLNGFNFNDIYVSYSDNGGSSWSAPVKLTNTHDWDELYPTFSKTGNTTTQFNLKFQATRLPGSSSFSDNAPVARVYHVLKKFNPANVGINEISGNVPDNFKLKQNYPNPFNPSTTIRFEIPKSSFVTLKVYDITGREVAQLVNQNLRPGIKEVVFDASGLSSGVYFYTIFTDSFRDTKKMVLVK